MAGYALSEADREVLRELIAQQRRQQSRGSASAGRPVEEPLAPDVYVVKVPEGGIPAVDDITPGYNSRCYVYNLFPAGTTPRLVPTSAQPVLVYNLSDQDLREGTWILVIRDKFGNWYAMASTGGGTTDVNTGTGTSSNTDIDERVKVSGNDTQAGYLAEKLVSGTGIALGVLDEGLDEQYRITSRTAVSSIDRYPDWLEGKVEAGTGINIEKVRSGEDEALRISTQAIQVGTGSLTFADEKVKVTGNDSASGFLYEQMEAGTGVALTVINPTADEKVRVSIRQEVFTSLDTDEKVKVSSADTTTNYLLDKLQAGSGVTLTKINPGGNELVEIGVLASPTYITITTENISVTNTATINIAIIDEATINSLTILDELVIAGLFILPVNVIDPGYREGAVWLKNCTMYYYCDGKKKTVVTREDPQTFTQPITFNQNVVFNYPITVNVPITFNQPITVNTTVTFNQPITVNNNVTFNNPVTFNQNIVFNYPITYNVEVTFNQPITVNNNVTFNNPVTFNNNVTFNNPVRFEQEITIVDLIRGPVTNPVIQLRDPLQGRPGDRFVRFNDPLRGPGAADPRVRFQDPIRMPPGPPAVPGDGDFWFIAPFLYYFANGVTYQIVVGVGIGLFPANTVLAGPGVPGADPDFPTARYLVMNDLPLMDQNMIIGRSEVGEGRPTAVELSPRNVPGQSAIGFTLFDNIFSHRMFPGLSLYGNTQQAFEWPHTIFIGPGFHIENGNVLYGGYDTIRYFSAVNLGVKVTIPKRNILTLWTTPTDGTLGTGDSPYPLLGAFDDGLAFPRESAIETNTHNRRLVYAIPDKVASGQEAGDQVKPAFLTLGHVLDFLFLGGVPEENRWGSVLFRGQTTWEYLLPGSPGNALTTHDVGFDPTWEPKLGGDIIGGGGIGGGPVGWAPLLYQARKYFLLQSEGISNNLIGIGYGSWDSSGAPYTIARDDYGLWIEPTINNATANWYGKVGASTRTVFRQALRPTVRAVLNFPAAADYNNDTNFFFGFTTGDGTTAITDLNNVYGVGFLMSAGGSFTIIYNATGAATTSSTGAGATAPTTTTFELAIDMPTVGTINLYYQGTQVASLAISFPASAGGTPLPEFRFMMTFGKSGIQVGNRHLRVSSLNFGVDR